MAVRDVAASDLEQLEIELLLEGIHRHYGYDFREYARSSIESASDPRSTSR